MQRFLVIVLTVLVLIVGIALADVEAPFEAEALREIAFAQAKAGDIAAALQTAERTDFIPGLFRARALSVIAISQARAGDKVAATETFAAALQTAQRIDNASVRADILRAIDVARVEPWRR